MFTLIELPYAPDGLEPVISAQTLGFHHGKHLQGYVNNLNAQLPGTTYEEICKAEESEELALMELIWRADPDGGEAPNAAVFNNAGQILNHNLYFTQFKTPDQVGGDGKEIPGQAGNDVKAGKEGEETVMPGSDRASQPQGALKAQIEKQWGSVEAFQAEFEAKGATLFGSGWVWLSATPATEGNPHGELVITQEPGASNPITKGLKPLLTFDVWEHAYYLDYQNRRADHLKSLWSIVNWQEIERRYTTK